MNLESMILTAAVVVTLLSLMLTPKNKVLEMQFVILFVQLVTWMVGLTVVQLGLIEYPYRGLASANRTSFIFEYLIMPVLCAHMNNYYPWRASGLVKAVYFASIASILTVSEVIVERYTMLITYTGWEWYWTLSTSVLLFLLNQKTVAWFFRSR